MQRKKTWLQEGMRFATHSKFFMHRLKQSSVMMFGMFGVGVGYINHELNFLSGFCWLWCTVIMRFPFSS